MVLRPPRTARRLEARQRARRRHNGHGFGGRYLSTHPQHLFQLGTIARPLNEYKNVHYILLARDHWLWRGPDDNIAIIEFDAFTRVLREASNLQAAMVDLLTYDWLPVEGRDFEVRMESARVGGVMLQSEIFYAIQEHRS